MLKKTFLTILIFVAGNGLLQAGVENGESAPDFTLTSAHGESHSLSDYEGKTVVLEWVNPYCPFVQKFYESGAMQRFQKKAESMGVVWLAINSTNPDSSNYLTPEESREWIDEHEVAAPWLMDPEGEVGQEYGARTTPHMYIINPEGKLVYQGGIDSIRSANPDDISKATNYVMTNLKAMQEGKELVDTQTRPYGCSVKYR